MGFVISLAFLVWATGYQGMLRRHEPSVSNFFACVLWPLIAIVVAGDKIAGWCVDGTNQISIREAETEHRRAAVLEAKAKEMK